MNWIQVLLIASIIALLVYLLRSRSNARSQAWVKVGYVVFVLAASTPCCGLTTPRWSRTGSGCAAAPT